MNLCRGCGKKIPDPLSGSGKHYCGKDCLDIRLLQIIGITTRSHPMKPVRGRTAPRWCCWCGETLTRGKMSFCGAACRASYIKDVKALL